MKLEKILDGLNSLEKNSFIKIVDGIIGNGPRNYKTIDKLLDSSSDNTGLKNLDKVVMARIFDQIGEEFTEQVKIEFENTFSQLDILSDILIRDGNCIMKRDWFAKLYQDEVKGINKNIKELKHQLTNPKSEISDSKKRDYKIYQTCIQAALDSDFKNNREAKITNDELAILSALTHQLGFSHEEIKLLNYMIAPVQKIEIEELIATLKNIGIIFYSKKLDLIYIPDEMVRTLRSIREKEIADKYFRRILRTLKEPQINSICRKYNIDRKLAIDIKIRDIINQGISFSLFLSEDIHKDKTNLVDKKKNLNELWSKNLNLSPALKGVTLEDKVSNVINHFDTIEKDEKVGISIDGYEKLLMDLGESLPKLNSLLKLEFELQDDNVLRSGFLLDFNIKPRDVLDLIEKKDIDKFCADRSIKTRGDNIENILESFRDTENLYLENYENIGYRNFNALKENRILIKESELGLKFEELTKSIFSQLGFDVDEKLRKNINTKKDQIDILLNLGNNDLILIECKTVKESGYNKFSSVSRQMKAYAGLVKSNDFKIVKSLLIAPEFSDEFINDTEEEFDLGLSLITASSLLAILEGFKKTSKHKKFPYKLLMRDVLISENRILKAISK